MARAKKTREITTETNTESDNFVDLDEAAPVSNLEPAQIGVEDTPANRAWPKPLGRTMEFEQLLEFMKDFTALQWSHAMIYLYRTWPIVYRDPKYIDVLTEAKQLNVDYIVSQFGGGRYKLMVTDTDRKDGNKNVCDAYLKISHIDHEPILNYDELDTGHRDNRTFVERLIAKGVLDTGGHMVKQNPIGQGTDNSSNDLGVLSATLQNVVNKLLSERTTGKSSIDETVMAKSLDLMSGAYKTALDTAVKQGNTSEIDQLTKVMAMFTQIVQLIKPDKQDSNMFDKFLVMQAEKDKLQMELFREITRNSQQKPAENQISGMLEIVSKVKEIFGLEGGSSHKPSTLETIMDKAPSILEPLSKILERGYGIAMMRQGQSGVQPSRAVTSIPTSLPQPEAGIGGVKASGMNPTNEPINALNNIPADAVAQLGFDPAAFVNQYGPIILQWINSNRTGDELAEWVESGFGSTTYLSVRNLGKDKMLTAMKMMPDFWQIVQPIEQQLSEFIDQFIAYAEATTDSDIEKGETVQ